MQCVGPNRRLEGGGWIGARSVFRLNWIQHRFHSNSYESYEDQSISIEKHLCWIHFKPPKHGNRNHRDMLKKQKSRYDRRYKCGTTALRYDRSSWGGTTEFSGDHQNCARTKTKIGKTFDPLGQSLWNLKRNFSRRLRTYSNQILRRSTSKFQPFSFERSLSQNRVKAQIWFKNLLVGREWSRWS